MELSELIRGAQGALDRGDYPLAGAACAHALETYPTCLGAHRLLGEALLESGDAEGAARHFEQTIALDPLSVVARLGLGVAAEERQDPAAAHAHYLGAWELNPALDQLRDELVRLRAALGLDRRLHPTRAGLGGVYARGGQLGRAAAEWRAVLAADPDNDRARVALTEMLWRAGDDEGTLAAGRDALTRLLTDARALALLAEVERRRGWGTPAETIARYRAADPTGEVAAALAEARPGTDVGFLLGEAEVPPFDFDARPAAVPAGPAAAVAAAPAAALAATAPNQQLAAPDLWDNLIRDIGTPGDAAGAGTPAGDALAPFAWADAGGGDLDADFSALLAPPTTFDSSRTAANMDPTPAAAGRPGTSALGAGAGSGAGSDLAALLAADPEPAYDPEAQQDLEGDAGLDLEALLAAGLADADVAPLALPEEEDAGISPGAGADRDRGDDEPVVSDPVDLLVAEEPNPAPGDAAAETEPDTEPDTEPSAGPGTDQTTAPADPAGPERFITADGRVDLTVGWDDLDRTLKEATPSVEALAGFDDLLAELGVDGIAPFDAVDPAEAAWEPFGADDWDDTVAADPDPDPAPAEPAPPAAAAGAAPDLADLAALGADGDGFDALRSASAGWDDIEEELAAAIPPPQASGYTAMFRNLDTEDVPVFEGGPQVDPLANPDAVGDPLAFDDLLAVTSQDGTAPLRPLDALAPADEDLLRFVADGSGPGAEASEEPLASAPDAFDPSPADLPAATAGTADGLPDLDGIEPFSFSDGASADRADAFAAPDFSDIDPPLFADGWGAGGEAPAEVPEAWADLVPVEPSRPAAAGDTALGATWDLGVGTTDAEPFGEQPTAALPPVEDAPPASDVGLGGETSEDEAAASAVSFGDMGVSPWPTFAAGTSALVAWRGEAGGLFARLRDEKSSLVELGMLAVDRTLTPPGAPSDPPPPPALALAEDVSSPDDVPSSTFGDEPGPDAPRAVVGNGVGPNGHGHGHGHGHGEDNGHSAAVGAREETRGHGAVAVADPPDGAEPGAGHGYDPAALRQRLKGGPVEAAAVAALLEPVVSDGGDAMLTRVLGEAYLKLGRTEQAAAQFRLALSRRTRRRP